jgi:hypothetical protein
VAGEQTRESRKPSKANFPLLTLTHGFKSQNRLPSSTVPPRQTAFIGTGRFSSTFQKVVGIPSAIERCFEQNDQRMIEQGFNCP